MVTATEPAARERARETSTTRPSTGRRYRGLSAEERRVDQRERLTRAAINEFAARGYHRTSVEDIVRSARTSRTAFYAIFDNREDAMYGALEESLRSLLASVQRRWAPHDGGANPIEVGVTAYVEFLVSDPAAARILLLESIGTSPEVNAYRSHVRRKVSRVVRDIWAAHDPQTASSPHASAVAVGVFGFLLESMLHLVESDRLDEAPAHVPALVCAVERILTSPI
jgi:AcrR family transcriptional regulator